MGTEGLQTTAIAPSETPDVASSEAEASCATNAMSSAINKTVRKLNQPSNKVKGDGVRILLVEDLPSNQELACAILRRAGHFVDIANDGIEAVAAAEVKAYDVILMDIRMPRMDGVSAARRIRELPGPAGQTPIVALTANAFPEQVRAFVHAGMDGYVAKPFQQQELLFAASSSLRLGSRSTRSTRKLNLLRQMVRFFRDRYDLNSSHNR